MRYIGNEDETQKGSRTEQSPERSDEGNMQLVSSISSPQQLFFNLYHTLGLLPNVKLIISDHGCWFQHLIRRRSSIRSSAQKSTEEGMIFELFHRHPLDFFFRSFILLSIHEQDSPEPIEWHSKFTLASRHNV